VPVARALRGSNHSPEANEKRAAILRLLADRGWVSLSQFAFLVGSAYPTVLRMRDAGQIQTHRVGGIYRVYLEEYNRFQRSGNRERIDDTCDEESLRSS